MFTRPKRYRKYSEEDLSAALELYLSFLTGSEKRSAQSVALQFKIPQRTFADYVKRQQLSKSTAILRSGPEPYLGKNIEDDIATWIVGRSFNKLPVTRSEIITASNRIKVLLDAGDHSNSDRITELLNTNPTTSCTESATSSAGINEELSLFSHSWLSRFLGRYPHLSPRQCESVNRSRINVSMDSLIQFLDSFQNACYQYGITTGDRIFNMDESFVAPDQKRDVVIVLRGTKDVSQRVKTCSFHTTVVVCGSAVGTVLPPMILLPGVRRPKGLTSDASALLDIALTPKGWMNSGSFMIFLQKFYDWLLVNQIQRPVILILDNASSHSAVDAMSFAKSHDIVIVFLPPNATHIAQPLDVAVFGPFKKVLNKIFRDLRISISGSNISKAEMIHCIIQSWSEGNIKENLRAGFGACGIWPIDAGCLLRRFKQFNQTSRSASMPHWIVAQMQARTEVLNIPTPEEPSSKRKKKQHPILVDFEHVDVTTQTVEGSESQLNNSTPCVCGLMCEEGQASIQCDLCNSWYHGECLSINTDQYPKDAEYICMFCGNEERVESEWEIEK